MPEMSTSWSTPASSRVIIALYRASVSDRALSDDLLQDSIEVKVLADTEDGLGQAGEPGAQRLILRP